jgi:hypothetical protein
MLRSSRLLVQLLKWYCQKRRAAQSEITTWRVGRNDWADSQCRQFNHWPAVPTPNVAGNSSYIPTWYGGKTHFHAWSISAVRRHF